MDDVKEWYVRTEEGNVYGPADTALLISWAEDGRVEPTGFVSRDRISWTPAQLKVELEMKWLVEIEPGKVFGPFNRKFVSKLFKTGSVPPETKTYRLHEYPIDDDPPPVIVEKVVEKIVEKIVEVDQPARTTLIVPEVVEAIDAPPPQRSPGGIFRHADRESLAALESAAQREIVAARSSGQFSFFGRKK